jgi:hypothetical protein
MADERSPRVRRWLVPLAGVAALFVVVLGLLVLFAYFDRRDLVRRAAIAWVAQQGAPAELRFKTLGATRLVFSLRIGAPDHPDLVVDEAEAAYSLQSLVRGRGPQVTAVRLKHPQLSGEFRGGQLRLGSLDRLIKALKPPPGAPPAPSPRIEIERGHLRLVTDYGLIEADGDGVVDKGRLVSLSARTAPVALKAGQAEATLGVVAARASVSGDRLKLAVEGSSPSARTPDASLTDAVFQAQWDLSYAALEHGRIDGSVSEDLSTGVVQAGSMTVRGSKLSMQWPRLTSDPGAGTSSGTYHMRATVAELAAPDSSLTGVSAEGGGGLEAKGQTVSADWTGAASGHGRWVGLGPPAKDDAPVLAAIKRGLSGFEWDLAKVRASFDRGQMSARLLGPARLRTPAGGRLDLDPNPGGYRLTLAGGALPDATADIRQVAFTSKGATAQVSADAAFSLGILEEMKVKGDGRMVVEGFTQRFFASRCADVAIKRVVLGDNDAQNFTGQLCPDGKPMITAAPNRWTIEGKLDKARASVPFLQAGVSEGSGAMRLDGRGLKQTAAFVIDEAKVTDLAKPLRFNPMMASGRADTTNETATAVFDIRPPKAKDPVAHADLRQNLIGMAGGLTISVPNLTFVPGGLQPTDLSPLTAALGEPVSGSATFAGRMDWQGDKTTSSGRLVARNLNFKSALGPVTGASMTMAFSSLAPALVGESEGPITAVNVAGPNGLTDLSAKARIDEQKITVSEGQATVGGGKVTIEATQQLMGDQTVKGTIRAEKVQLHDLVEASPFSDKLDLTAQVNGRIPFEMTDGKLRIRRGNIRATGPGRLSVNRTTFNPGGAKSGPATQDNLATFGYQALEDLAFELMDATIQSDPDGRLHTVFHIAGRHAPPAKKELRLTWQDLLSKDVLNRPMPLPSDTVVNLTLDTTLNLDDLIKSQGSLNRQLGSSSVQSSSLQIGDASVGAPVPEKRK